ncbi:MAG TPA: carbon-nitrogen hydrolase family protein [Vicinamibacteria bacterium]|nr:carbon-nitrogen hydrolase family protein [Vicinamibacteria bacterium]
MSGRLRVAACQFPVTGDVAANGTRVRRLLAAAAARGAHLVQFPEAALSGYGGFHFRSFAGYDWAALRAETRRVLDAARAAGVFVLLGSAHSLGRRARPTNCMYVIDRRGRVADRYDKSMGTPEDLRVYTPGDRRVVFSLRGVRCGVLVCYDGCYPELYAAYRAMGVELMLHSFHNAGFEEPNVLDEYKPALIRTRAADNGMWVVACNSSARHSSWATCVARPDGSIAASLRRHATGILVHDFPDPRLRGWLHNLRPYRLHPKTPLHNGRPSRSARARDGRSHP